MKSVKITYWATTTLISMMMLMSASMYFTNPEVKEGFTHLGFPQYFRVELALAKLAGVLVLMIPAIKGRVKEWAYFGFFVTFASAFIAHFSSGDPVSKWMGPIIATVLLLVSYFSYQRMQEAAVVR